jgi:hypothetical protein
MSSNATFPKPPAPPSPRPIRFADNDDDLGVSLAQTFTLLPLRVETRFLPAGDQASLCIRIYPDQIAIDSFDPALTNLELADAVSYGQTLATCSNSDTAAQQTAWQFLANRYGAGRAAYLADAVLSATQLASWLNSPCGTILQTVPGVQLASATLLTANLEKLGARSSSYGLAPLARCLPTRWLVYGVTNGAGTIAYEIKRPLNDDLHVGPSGASVVPASTPGGASADPEMLWMVDFQKAVNVGMAATIPLTQSQAKSGFTTLYVVGICDADPAATQTTLERLLLAHRFSDGWAIVTQGTPTKNASNASSGYSSKDPNFATSFAAERQLPLANCAANGTPQGPDGSIVAESLGLAPTSVEHLQGVAGTNQFDAACMANAVWAGTIGYYLQFIAQAGGQPSALTREIHGWFTDRVRGRGSIPAMRVGNVPYGVLPVGVINQLIPPQAPDNNPLISLLRTLWIAWQSGEQDYLGKTNDDVTDLGAVADLTPSSTTYTATKQFDPQLTQLAWSEQQGSYLDQLYVAQQYESLPAAQGVAPIQWLTNWGSPLLAFPTTLADQPTQPVVAVVVDEQSPTENSETMVYIQHLCNIYEQPTSNACTTVQQLINEASGDEAAGTAYKNYSFLYLTLRASVLISLGIASAAALGIEPPAEPELIDFAGEANTPTQTLQRLIFSPISGTGQTACEAVLSQPSNPDFADFFKLGACLKRLSVLPSAELERLFTETLDCALARLDAWITAIATENLSKYSQDNRGKLIGGYAWLYNVVPDQTPVSSADVATLEQIEDAVAAATGSSPVPVNDIRSADVDNGGFVFAPSANQAATVAILRNADLTNKDAGELGIPLNLSSARVRNAISYLNGVRQGVALGVLMGERAEEALADANLSAYIQPLRNTFPLIANKLTQPSGTASDVAAPNVIDGVALEQAMANGLVNWHQVVSNSGAQLTPVQAANDEANLPITLGFLSDDLASITDLSISETIYQIVRGNPERAGSILDAIQSGAQIPEPQVVSTPRTGLAVTHRVLTVGGGDPKSPPSSPWGAKTPRALAEPWLEAWLGSILPSAQSIAFVCEYTDPNKSIYMTVSDLGLGALDLLAMADTPNASLASDLHDYIMYKAQAKGAPLHPVTSTIEIFNLNFSSSAVPLGNVLPVLLAARDLLSRSRPLQIEDLCAPSGSPISGIFDARELEDRVRALGRSFMNAIMALTNSLNSFNAATATSAQATALVKDMAAMLTYGIPQATPQIAIADATANAASARTVVSGDTAPEYSALAAQASTILNQANRRVSAFTQALSATPVTLKSLSGSAQAILGSSFVIMPLLPAQYGSDFIQSTTDWNKGINGADSDALCAVVQQLTHVRPAIAALDLFRASIAIVNQSRIVDFSVAQVGYQQDVPWLVLPITPQDAGKWPTSWMGRASLISWMPISLSSSAPYLYGLVFDDWAERIPSKSEKAAIAFHYSEPLAQAPQAILIAMASTGAQMDGAESQQRTWNYQTLVRILDDTFSLMKVRVTDPTTVNSAVPGLSQLFMAFNTNNNTVDTMLEPQNLAFVND